MDDKTARWTTTEAAAPSHVRDDSPLAFELRFPHLAGILKFADHDQPSFRGCCLTMYWKDGYYTVIVNDRNRNRSLFRVSRTPAGCMSALDAELSASKPRWTDRGYKGPSKGKNSKAGIDRSPELF